MTEPVHLNQVDVDVLKEVGNIGAGNAITALSTILQESVRISVTKARLCEFDDIAQVVGGPEVIAAGVFIRIYGDIAGNMMLLLTLPSAKQLIHKLFAPVGEEIDFTELQLSVLAEVGNILGGSYLTALSSLTGLKMYQSVPAVAIDMAGAILDIGILAAGETADSAILIDTSIMQGESESDIDGHVFLLPDPDSMKPLLNALGY